ncbi:uncharacterized protein C8orf34 homolog isoform X1 [Mizuhopecten yessoensis]|uniref:uncharacterized protein C8orf34 homolog isoform X1 n=1 Tax=Mizuhopecten yessoensis TaxID=6573 RepID=UPI000B45DA3C|nr:uncharacterized protein C8orf34 homolog isoform X1 [Mizuhopecten yessoensis]
MGTPQKMQHYMERHRLSSLFEDLMNKVLHDQPEKPLIYLIKVLYKKAGMDTPTDLKLAGVRRSSPERIMNRNRSPEMTRKATTQAWASKSVDVTGRGYNKPWQTHSKKPKATDAEYDEPVKPAGRQVPKHLLSDSNLRPQSTQSCRPHSQTLRPQSTTLRPQSANLRPQSALRSPSSPRHDVQLSPLDDVLLVTPISPGKKQKGQPWNTDNKVGFSSFDEIFEESPGKAGSSKQKKKPESSPTDARKAWGSSGMDDDNVQYNSTNYRGPRTNRYDNDDPLAGEIMNEKGPSVTKETAKVVSTSRVRGRKVDAKSHRKELEQMITEESQNDSGYGEEKGMEEEDDAIELLEDGEELRKEGARNISNTGYKLSRIMRERQQEANVKLNINLYTGPQPADSFVAGM